MPEDCRLLRRFIASNPIKRILYIGAATCEDLICWLPVTHGYAVEWFASEIDEQACEAFRAPGVTLLRGDYVEHLTRDYQCVICNYVFNGEWDDENRRRFELILKNRAKIVFARDVVKRRSPAVDLLEYRRICRQNGYDVFEHKNPIDLDTDACKGRDACNVLIRRSCTYTADAYTQLVQR